MRLRWGMIPREMGDSTAWQVHNVPLDHHNLVPPEPLPQSVSPKMAVVNPKLSCHVSSHPTIGHLQCRSRTTSASKKHPVPSPQNMSACLQAEHLRKPCCLSDNGQCAQNKHFYLILWRRRFRMQRMLKNMYLGMAF